MLTEVSFGEEESPASMNKATDTQLRYWDTMDRQGVCSMGFMLM